MKIIFVGAGMASLVAAEKLGKGGFEVVVYEKDSYENISYDWHDDVNSAAFTANGLPLPKEGTFFTKRNWTFVPPDDTIKVSLNAKEELLDWSTERRLLAQQYVDRAKPYVDFHFECAVDGLTIENNAVTGVVINGEKISADLVVDNSGAMSKLRASLPDSFKIQQQPKRDEVFCAYRAFHERAEGSPDAEYTNKAYLKHLGEEGISWCIQDPSGTVNVLVGRVAELPKQVFERAYSALKADNPTISDKVVRGGGKYIIPIRYPLTRMVADGYVAIGDCAFMTIPMLGSGIENSFNAACILAEVLLKTKSSKKEDLWQYQVAYYKHIGARHIGIDVLKRWLLSSDNDDLSFLFRKKIVNDKIMFCGATGQLIYLSPKEMLDKVFKGYTKIGLLLSLNSLLMKTHKAERIGLKIPSVYDDAQITAWEKRVESFFAK